MPDESLSQKKCQPCEGMEKALSRQEAAAHLPEVPEWLMNSDGTGISREYVMRNFPAAIHFINQVADIAEKENHHPDIHLTGYRRLRIDLSTHAVKGLSENDFIVAAKINLLPAELKK